MTSDARQTRPAVVVVAAAGPEGDRKEAEVSVQEDRGVLAGEGCLALASPAAAVGRAGGPRVVMEGSAQAAAGPVLSRGAPFQVELKHPEAPEEGPATWMSTPCSARGVPTLTARAWTR